MKDIMLKKLHSTATTTTSSSSAEHSHNNSTNSSSSNHKNKSSSSAYNSSSGRSAEEEDEGASKSLLLFLAHRRQELATEIDRLHTHIQAASLTLIPQLFNTDLNTPNTVLTRIKWQVYTFMNHLSRMLYFGMNGYSDILNDTYTSYTTPTIGTGVGTIRYGLGQYLIYALRDKYGLDQVSKEIKRYITVALSSIITCNTSNSISEIEVQELLSCIKYWKREVCMKILRVMGGQSYDLSDIHNKHKQRNEMISFTDLFTPLPIHPPSSSTSSASDGIIEDKSRTITNTTNTTQLSNSKKRKRIVTSPDDTDTNTDSNTRSENSNTKMDEQTGLSSYLSSLPVKLEVGSGSGKHCIYLDMLMLYIHHKSHCKSH